MQSKVSSPKGRDSPIAWVQAKPVALQGQTRASSKRERTNVNACIDKSSATG